MVWCLYRGSTLRIWSRRWLSLSVNLCFPRCVSSEWYPPALHLWFMDILYFGLDGAGAFEQSLAPASGESSHFIHPYIQIWIFFFNVWLFSFYPFFSYKPWADSVEGLTRLKVSYLSMLHTYMIFAQTQNIFILRQLNCLWKCGNLEIGAFHNRYSFFIHLFSG